MHFLSALLHLHALVAHFLVHSQVSTGFVSTVNVDMAPVNESISESCFCLAMVADKIFLFRDALSGFAYSLRVSSRFMLCMSSL